MKTELRRQVSSLANESCEYCRVPQSFDPLPFGMDHIRPQYHHGPAVAANLALACFNCNCFKGTNAAGYDPETDELTPLFNPRTDTWEQHFEWNGPELRGMTSIGRTTIDVLRINLPERVELRRLIRELGVFPPSR